MTDRFQSLQNRYLHRVMTLVSEVIHEYSGRDASLTAMADYHLGTGGKRLRAVLPLAVAETLGHAPDRLVPFAGACELIHNATLVHDDLQDRDTRRRGQPTVWTEFGEAQAINLGDAMFFYAMACAQKLDVSDGQKNRILDRITRSTLRVIAGQENEFKLQTVSEPTVQDYQTMVEGKTSGLFALPMSGAALLCDAPTILVDTLDAIADQLGVLFQVQDDVLDVYGDKGRAESGSDIGEGKRSLMAIHALSHGSPADSERLRQILDTPRAETTLSEVEEARTFFDRTNALGFALDTIVERRRMAMATAETLGNNGLLALIADTCTVFERPIAALLATHRDNH